MCSDVGSALRRPETRDRLGGYPPGRCRGAKTLPEDRESQAVLGLA